MSIQKLDGTPIAGGPIRFGGNEYQSSLVDNGSGQAGGIDIGEIVFTLSRHKWKIMLLGMMGLAAAAAAYLMHEASYQTNAKLLVRYVLERNTVDSEIQSSIRETSGRTGASVLQDEMEILTSWDLAKEVAESVGIEVLIPDPGEIDSDVDLSAVAAGRVVKNLGVSSGRNSNVISVSYQNNDPEVAVKVLQEMITRYFDKHLEIHRPVGATEFISEQTRKVDEKLQEIEDELNRLKRQAGRGAVAGNTKLFETLDMTGKKETVESSWWSGLASWASARQDLLAAESERAAQTARLSVLGEVIGRIPTADSENETAPVQPSEAELAQYQSLIEQLAQMRLRNASLRQKFPPGSRLIAANEGEIKTVEAKRSALAAKYPILTTIAADENSLEEQSFDIASERMLLASTEARIKVLKSKVAEVQEAEENMPILLSKIHDLLRLKASEEEKYFYLTSEVEKAQIDGMLDPSKMPNITVIQSASPPVKVLDPKFKGIVLMLAGSGFALGIGLALLKELFLDRRIKRSADFGKRLSIPLMLTIPLLPFDRRKALPKNSSSNENGSDKLNGSSISLDLLDSANPNEARFWPYAAAIRDRIFSHFLSEESQSGPKMIALTGFTQGSGTSTLAKSVATMYAATREKVLLIDMNVEGNEPNSIYEAEVKLKTAGKKSSSDDDSKGSDREKSNIFEAEGNALRFDSSALMVSGKNSGSVSPKDLYNLLPLIRQSDYSCVIFDMPPLAPTSPTNAMAGFMDIVLLIVDATRTNREVVKSGYEDLLKVNSHVTCIYNKSTETDPGDRLDVVAERRRQLVEGMVS